jgi:hypothetical protein
MKIYVKPSMEVIKLRAEEGIACFGSNNSDGGNQSGGHSGGGHHGGGSSWEAFWFWCN